DFSILKLRQPLIYDLDDFRRVAIVKMIGAVDQLASAVRRRASGDFLRVFVEKLGFGAADDGEQRTANQLGVRPAVVSIIFTIFVQVTARAENSRRGADRDRHKFFASAFGDHRLGSLDELAKSRLTRDAL